VPVGNDGETLVADSSTSTGLSYQANWAAGKNKIINGAFDNWQRGTSFNLTSSAWTFTADRFQSFCAFSAGTATASRQTFTPGTAPVAGYEGTYYSRITCGSTTSTWGFRQNIEDVRTLAGQTVTLSFWIKASAANATTSIEIAQVFGSGGSGTVTTTLTGPSITTSWQRFSVTFTMPSVSGKTIGTSSYVSITLYSATSIASSLVVDTWGWQLEAGSTATAFQTATGTIQGELAACQRYYYQWSASNAYSPFATGFTSSTTSANLFKPMPVTMRITPTITTTGTATNYAIQNGTNGRVACTAVPSINQGNPDGLNVDFTTAAVLTAGGAITGNANNTTSAYLGFSAEL
jgi:hypothetical protein